MIETEALSISPPQEVYRRTTSTGVDAFALPAKMHKSWINVTPFTQDCWVRFVVVRTADSDPSAVDSTTASSLTGDVIGPVTNAGYRLTAGLEKGFNLQEIIRGWGPIRSDQQLWMLTKAAGSGSIEFYKSSGPKGA